MARLIEKDYGTPASAAEATTTLTIDQHEVTVPAGTSVMRAARDAGIDVPALCASDRLEAFGSCRLCLVEIEGRRGYPASCHTPVEDGMKVSTRSDKLDQIRRGVMELYMSDHPSDHPDDGRSDMHELARRLKVTKIRYGRERASHSGTAVDDSNPYFRFDPAACIVCSRCVRACDEIQGTFALTVAGRGFDSKIVASQDQSFFDSECVSCGACVQACPTDALLEKSIEQAGMPDTSVVTTCGYCGVGCSFKAELKQGELIRMMPYKHGKANHGHSCVKGRFAYGYSTHPDRVTRPLIRNSIDEDWREVGWDEAIAHAAGEIRRIQGEYGRDAFGGISSSRCTNEETFLVQKMVRAEIGRASCRERV